MITTHKNNNIKIHNKLNLDTILYKFVLKLFIVERMKLSIKKHSRKIGKKKHLKYLVINNVAKSYEKMLKFKTYF